MKSKTISKLAWFASSLLFVAPLLWPITFPFIEYEGNYRLAALITLPSSCFFMLGRAFSYSFEIENKFLKIFIPFCLFLFSPLSFLVPIHIDSVRDNTLLVVVIAVLALFIPFVGGILFECWLIDKADDEERGCKNALTELRRADAKNEFNINGHTDIVHKIYLGSDDTLIIEFFEAEKLLAESKLDGMLVDKNDIILKKELFDLSNIPISLSANSTYPSHEMRISLPINDQIILHLAHDNEADAKTVKDWVRSITNQKAKP